MPFIEDGELWSIRQHDCITAMFEDMPESSVDFSVFSPPFPALYAYGSDESDIGNTESFNAEAKLHLSWFYRSILRVLKPGRVAAVHVMQLPKMKRSGEQGLCDFRGINIRLAERAGLVYEGEWLIRKNPQSQAIRNRSRELQFTGLEADRAKSRGALADYIIKLMKPGENAVPINSEGQVSRNQWIEWAEAAWFDIRETNTLNTKSAKGEDDTRHICPLQLDVIERLVRMYTNPGELVFSPFAGIGSEGYVSLKLDRRFYGTEIKTEYVNQARKNLAAVVSIRETEQTLF